MGILVGGAIIVVLALQTRVVEWPDPDPTASAGTSPQQSVTVAPPPPDGRIVSGQSGPVEAGPGDLVGLTAPALPDALVEMRHSLRDPDRSREGTAAQLGGDVLHIGTFDGPEALGMQKPPEIQPTPDHAEAPRRTASATIAPVDWPLRSKPMEPAPAAVAAVPQLRGVDPVPVGLPVPRLLSGETQAQTINPQGAEPPVVTPRIAVPTQVGEPGAPAALGLPLAVSAGPRETPRAQADFPADPLRPLAPPKLTGTARPPMVLWFSRLGQAVDAAPFVISVSATSATAASGGALVALPSLAQADGLASAIAALGTGTRPAALLLAPMGEGAELLLAPVLDRSALDDLPWLLPAGAPSAVHGLLRGRGVRTLPVYTHLSADLDSAALAERFARIAQRAQRDGLVAVELAPDPELLEAVATWRAGPGSALGAATLVDAFGG